MEKVLKDRKDLMGSIGSRPGSMKTFFVVWSGQLVSLMGSSMTGFALGVWIFQQTGSATSFALTLLFNMLPKAVVAPVAGILADAHDRRWIMIVADTMAGMATLAVASLLVADRLSVWHIYALTALNASASALQAVAFSAAVTQLVPKREFGRANGLLQLGEGAGQVVAPLLAGVLMGKSGVLGVVLVDMATFVFAVGTLLSVRVPGIPMDPKVEAENEGTWLKRFQRAVMFLRTRPGLLGLMLVFALVNFFVGVAEAVLTPMVLSTTGPESLGIILTAGGIGMLAGSLVASVFRGGRRKVYAVFGAYALLGASVSLAGISASVGVVGVAVFSAFFFLPTVMSASQAILQRKVAPEIQGRVFGLRIFLNTLSFAAAYLLGGVTADSVFEPWMRQGGALAGTLGPLIGTGPGRGMGLMFVLMGILAVLSALSTFAQPRIRRVEIELPDMVGGNG